MSFGGGAPKVPQREDPAVAEARRRQRLAEQLRRGRQQLIATSPAGLTGDTLIGRPSLVG